MQPYNYVKSGLLAVFILLLLGAIWKASAQGTLPCGHIEHSHEEINRLEKRLQFLKKSKKSARVSSENTTNFVPIRFHIIRRSDGTGGLTIQDLNQVLAKLNEYYIICSVQYYMAGSGPDYIDRDEFYDYMFSQEAELCDARDLPDAINVYIPNTISFELDQVAGYAYYPSTQAQSNRVFIRSDVALDQRMLAHELGHYFNLLHTFENNNSPDPAQRELVTRGEGANCVTTGDLLCDTPADPYGLPNSQTSGCNYVGTVKDPNGALYQPMLSNIMSYYTSCGNNFTPQQYARMADGYLLRTDPLNQYTLTYHSITDVVTNVEAQQVADGVQITFLENSSIESGYLIERATSAEGPFVNIAGLGPNQTTFLDNSVQTNTTYYYRVRASNGIHYSNVASCLVQLFYCIPVYNNPCFPNMQIADFFMQSDLGISNLGSGCSLNSFGNFTSMTGQVTAGATYTFTARAVSGGLGLYLPQHLSIWIDTNQNGIFEASEMVYQSTDANYMQPSLNGSFTIPSNTLIGTTRMRIRSNYQLLGRVTDPCARLSFGEAEDYTLQVASNISPSSIQTTTVSPTATCTEGAISVAFTQSGSFGAENSFIVQIASVETNQYVSLPTAGNVSPLSATLPASINPNVYNVRVIASNPTVLGTASIQTLQVTPRPAPPSISATSSTICSGSSTTLSALGCSGGTINWSNGSTGRSITLSPTATTSYTATCTVSGCVSTSSIAVNIEVTPRPAAFITGESVINSGEEATILIVLTNGSTPWNYQLADGTIGSSTTSTSVSLVVTPSTTTTYTLVTVSNDCGVGTTSGSAKVTVIEPSQESVSLDLRVILEGAFNSVTQLMRTTLNQYGLLPGQTPTQPRSLPTPPGHPYTIPPWNYRGSESMDSYEPDIVDWILISLRSSTISMSEIVFQTAGLLRSDGRVVIIGPDPVLYTQQSYYVVIEHRNHLGIMSPAPVAIRNGLLSWDFTQQDSYLSSSFGQKKIGEKYVMATGDIRKVPNNQNFDINFGDFQVLQSQNGQFLMYLPADLNLDADVNFRDPVLLRQNSGLFSAVPRL